MNIYFYSFSWSRWLSFSYKQCRAKQNNKIILTFALGLAISSDHSGLAPETIIDLVQSPVIRSVAVWSSLDCCIPGALSLNQAHPWNTYWCQRLHIHERKVKVELKVFQHYIPVSQEITFRLHSLPKEPNPISIEHSEDINESSELYRENAVCRIRYNQYLF